MLTRLLATISTRVLKIFSTISALAGLTMMGVWVKELPAQEKAAAFCPSISCDLFDLKEAALAETLDGVCAEAELEPPSLDPPSVTVLPMLPGSHLRRPSGCTLREE